MSIKYDENKPRLDMVLGGFSRALIAVGEVGTRGAEKYSENGWMGVENGKERYTSAMLRHYFGEVLSEDGINHKDFHLLHAAHLAWNALARLELILREKEDDNV